MNEGVGFHACILQKNERKRIMNKLTIIGNLVADPQSHATQDGKTVCNFSLAVNRRQKKEGQPDADFFRVAAWNQLGENCQKYLAKGRKVCVSGPVSVRTYQAQDGSTRASMEVIAQDVEFLSSGAQGGQAPGTAVPAQAEQPSGGFTAVETDELPF